MLMLLPSLPPCLCYNCGMDPSTSLYTLGLGDLLVMNKNTLLWGMGWQLLVVDMNYARSKCVGFMLSLENE